MSGACMVTAAAAVAVGLLWRRDDVWHSGEWQTVITASCHRETFIYCHPVSFELTWVSSGMKQMSRGLSELKTRYWIVLWMHSRERYSSVAERRISSWKEDCKQRREHSQGSCGIIQCGEEPMIESTSHHPCLCLLVFREDSWETCLASRCSVKESLFSIPVYTLKNKGSVLASIVKKIM